MQFEEVLPEHFRTISRTPFPHILIDRALMQLGGNGPTAAHFHMQVLAAAGWKHHSMIPFGQYPQEAADAYNRIRQVLNSTEDPKNILQELAAQGKL